MDIAIIANGEYPRSGYPRYLIEHADFAVCCDAAADKYWRHTGRLPHAVVGDLDSLSSQARSRFQDRIIHIADQDTNDLTKAFGYVMDNIVTDRSDVAIHILAATGRREDHAVANLSLLMEYERRYGLSGKGIRLEMVSDWSTMFPVTDSCSFDCGKDRPVSILTPDPSLRIASQGLQWPLDNVVFDNWWKATLNRATSDTVSLTFSHPSIALIVLG